METRSEANFGHWKTLYQLTAPFSSRTRIDPALAVAFQFHGIDPNPAKWKGHAFRSIPRDDSTRLWGTVATVRYQPESGALMVCQITQQLLAVANITWLSLEWALAQITYKL